MWYPLELRSKVRQIIRKYPQLEGRAWRGALYYQRNRVSVNGDGFNVISLYRGEVYHVTLTPFTCTCKDYKGALVSAPHSAPMCGGQPVCKHIVAAYLATIFG